MGDGTVKTSAVFLPKRQWKPKRRDRNLGRRKKRRRWWRQNKARIKLRRNQRMKRLRNNALFKAWRKKRQREKHKRRMRFASGETVFPEAWFLFRDDGDVPRDIDLGYIVDYDPDTEELLIYDVDDGEEKVVALDDFLKHSEFVEDADLANFELIMNQYYGAPQDDLDLVDESEEAPPDDAPLQVDAIIERVARRYLLKSALGRE